MFRPFADARRRSAAPAPTTTRPSLATTAAAGRRRRALRELAGLSGGALRDIGLSRADVGIDLPRAALRHHGLARSLGRLPIGV